ncbi:MAG: hypothetical protein RJA09_2250 [Pseudomonadota bacterium]|jgi:hypothetical protein
MSFLSLLRATLCGGLIVCSAAHAVPVVYDFSGSTGAYGTYQSYTGQAVIDLENTTYTTQYFLSTVQQGFRTTYQGGLLSLQLKLADGNVVGGGGGNIWVNNIQQAESGAQVPQGLSVQMWGSGMYLAFTPPANNPFSWDPLDAEMSGNSEKLLESQSEAQALEQQAAHAEWLRLRPPGTVDPYPFPTGTLDLTYDPLLTGTALPANLETVFAGLVNLGTNEGLVNRFERVDTFALGVLDPEPVPPLVPTGNTVPEPNTPALLGLGVLAWWGVRRYRPQTKAGLSY